MPALNDLGSVGARQFGTMSFQTGLVAAGTNAGTIKTVTNIIPFAIDGVFAAKAVTDNIVLAAPTVAQLASGWERWVFYTISATDVARVFYMVHALAPNGDVVTFQGDYSGQDLTFRGMPLAKGTGLIPDIPTGFAPFAVIKIENPASLTFVPATTPITTASSRVATIKNVCTLPAATTF